MEGANFIRKAAAEHGVNVVSDPIADLADPGSFFVNVAVSKNQKGQQVPRHKALADLRQLLLAHGIKPKYILINPEIDQSEESLRASLISSYPDLIRNVFLGTQDGSLLAWLETKSVISDNELATIKDHVAECGKALNARSTSVLLISDEPIPTNTEILTLIRKYGPVSCEVLERRLREKGFSVPSLDWINRKFDALRKSDLVVRIADRTYVVTSEGLHRLGTAKGRHSADIARLLALARAGG